MPRPAAALLRRAGSFALASCLRAALLGGLWPASATAADPGVAKKVAEARAVAARGPFAPDWTSLSRFEVPAWYADAKFGIFIHWGAYSVPAFGNEWYPRNMYTRGSKEHAHHLATYGPLTAFGYKDFIPLFKAERFDAKRWAALFKAAGARYVVPVAEHHDGFPMYDYPFTAWSAVKMGPRRDVVGELAQAVRGAGLVFGASSHRIENWFFYGEGRKVDSDVTDPRFAGLYGPAANRDASEKGLTPPTQEFLDDWLARSAELVDRYQPQLVWFDWWIAQPPVHPNLQTFAAFYYNRGKEWGKTLRSLAAGSPHLTREVQGVELLGSRETLQWSRDASGLRVALPKKAPTPLALALRISLR